MHVCFGAGNIQIAAHDETASGLRERRRVVVHRFEEPQFRGKVFAAVRHVHGSNGQFAERGPDLGRDDAVFEVECGMEEDRRVDCGGAVDVEADARVPLRAVPVRPVAFEPEERFRDLIRGGFEFLETDDVRARLRDPFLDLRVPRPDTVDVPGGDLQKRACAA
jgi:hypothetical protein